ncbi:leucine-rich repeat and calponin homology domain-containing protein-like isoform X8 [Biomphalaria glabrata]|uniref:Leucine-rich repeat and calponin homology domain-containing protein-like isoform X8 n=1 Tax=Biomphalaria glabrata TaxID=6526 RepID=A0A9U8E1N7_BIOGL|nr:leucine-rich repeat and calponin homology domain-containing protein-like isoform X8 [Biomphalaria glabrata]
MKNKMAASYGSGLQSPPPIGRPVDRVFEDAQYTGEIYLNGRKLRDYPKLCTKYDLSDTTHVDISRNRLTELPHEVCDYIHVERVNCYHNVIRSIPDAISQLQTLTHLNLSRNQLTVLPTALCLLNALEILSVSNNKLVSLPEEIGKLENLMDLDVSCNEISHLPLQIGDLTSLRCLNLRRNFLVELPFEISRLQLFKLDFSSNRIERIPIVFRKMETLEQLILDHNPLSSPPAYICTKGRQHIMKYLHIQAVKEDRKRGILNNDPDMKRNLRKSLPPQQSSEEFRNMLVGPESKWKRHTVLSNDSGYSTSDGTDRNGWQSAEVYEENIQGSHDRYGHNVPHQQIHHYRGHLGGSVSGLNKSSISSSVSTTIYENENNHHPRLDGTNNSQPNRFYSDSLNHRPPLGLHTSSAQTSYLNGNSTTFYHYPPSPSLSRARTINSSSSSLLGSNNLNSLHNRSFSPTPSETFHHKSSSSVLTRQHSNSSLSSNTPQDEESRSNYVPYSSTHEKSSTNVPTSDAYTNRYLMRQKSSEYVSRSYLQSGDYQAETSTSPPPSSMVMAGDLEDEFTRELKRQKAEYERKKKQAEQIKAKQLEEEEELEKEERRRATLKVQEEQKLLLEKEKQEEARRQEERLHQEEEKRKKDEEALHHQEMLSKQDYARNQILDENKLEDTQKPTESKLADRNKIANKNALSSQSFKEQRRLANSTQYRRAASDTLKKPGQQVDVQNFINRNGETSTLSSTSTTPSVSPSPSPRNSVSHLAKPGSPSGSTSHLTKPNSPSGSMSQLAKPVANKSSVPRANGPASTGTNQTVRRTKMAGDSSNASSPVTARSTKASGIANMKTSLNPATSNIRRSSNSSTTDDDSKSKKTPSTPTDPSRLKSKLEEPKQRGTIQAPGIKKTSLPDNVDTNRRIQNRPPANNFGSGRGRVGAKTVEDSSALRRRDEAHREEAEQMDRLRQTIESRLRVTLPDNLAEALRDGVVLCHLANQIRPRSVGSIHVPSPAVPKLTVAKCRRNVDNFLDACRKIGVDHEMLCDHDDIIDGLRLTIVAQTVQALIRLPRLDPKDFYVANLCIALLFVQFLAFILVTI